MDEDMELTAEERENLIARMKIVDDKRFELALLTDAFNLYLHKLGRIRNIKGPFKLNENMNKLELIQKEAVEDESNTKSV